MDSGNEELFFSGDEYFDRLAASLRAAKRSVDVQCYIFSDDQCGRSVAEELIRCAKRGVRVRVIVDGFGSGSFLPFLSNTFQAAGVHFCVYHPMRVLTILGSVLPSPGQPGLVRVLRRMNRRNHRKVFIIDDNEVFLGSMNVINVHMERYAGERVWRDACIWFTGNRVRDLAEDFDWVWIQSRDRLLNFIRSGFRKKKPRCPDLVLLNTTLLLRRRARRQILRRLRSVQSELFIANAYVVPDRGMVRALCSAARRGVDVRLMVAHRSDVLFMSYIASGYYRHFLRAGVRVFQYETRMLHAKTIIADDWALVGSSNLNHRSVLHDLEADVVVTAADRRAALREHFIQDLKECSEVTMKELNARSLWTRMVSSVGFYFRYWL